MVTREDLNTVDVWVDPVDSAEWRHVMYGDDRYLLVASDMKDSDYDRLAKHLMDSDPLAIIVLKMMEEDERSSFLKEQSDHLKHSLPPVDVAVFRGDENWEIQGECNDECASGFCKKRVASRFDGNIDTAYAMLVDYLNA